jgi:hypothetical protein
MHNVYTDLPPGTEATGKVRNCTDTFNGWGMFVRQNGFLNIPWVGRNTIPNWVQACGPGNAEGDAISASGTSVMMLYQQHSHNTTRTVQYEAGYHPLKNVAEVHQITLTPLSLFATATNANAAAGTVANTPTTNASAPNSLFGAAVHFAIPIPLHSSLAVSTNPAGPAPAQPVKLGYLRYGQTYEARLDPNADGWTLRIRTFTGDDIVATESKADPQLGVAQTDHTNFKRVLITPKAPF